MLRPRADDGDDTDEVLGLGRPADESPKSGPIRIADALAIGVAPRELRRSGLVAPFHGVRTSADVEIDLVSRCEALLSVLDGSVVFSHATALRLHGVDIPWRVRGHAADDAAPHVVTLREPDRPQRKDVVAHRSRQSFLETTRVGSLPVTTPAQTFVHVAVGLLPDEIVVLGDAMMRRKSMLTSLAELADVAERTKKVKGIAMVRDQISRMRPGTDSVMETRTRLRLIAENLPCPVVNEVVYLDDGTYVKRCDLIYPEQRLVIEYDGDQHRTDQAQWRDDIRRRRWLEELGYTVVVVVGDDFAAPHTRGSARDFVARVRAGLARPVLPSPGAPRTFVGMKSTPLQR